MNGLLQLPDDYAAWLSELKHRIQGARQKAVLAANHEQIRLYHSIGHDILHRQNQAGWGAKVIAHISADLCDAFPDMKGFSSRNLKYMSYFAKLCPDGQFGQQSAAQLPWFHIVTLLTKVSDPAVRQHRLEVDGDEFFIDLLFYHTKLKCYVVVELKAKPFKPEHAGQLNFYLSAVDAQLKAPDDKPTIGLLLCKTKKRLVAEYALSGIEKPMGVAEYQLVRALPEPLDTNLPTVEELEEGLARDLNDEENVG